MAGRPAGGRGLTGLHYGLIATVIVAVAALVAFILQLTKVKEMQARADSASREMNAFGSPPSYYRDEAGARNGTVFGVMNDDLQKLATLIAGESAAVRPALEQQANALIASVVAARGDVLNVGDTLLTCIGKLDKALGEARSAATSATDELRAAQRENESLSAQIKGVKDDFASQVDSLGKQLDAARSEKQTGLDAKDRQLTDLQGTLESATQELNKIKSDVVRGEREKDLVIARLQAQVEDLQKKIAEIKPTSFDPDAILTKADGKILRAIPGSDIVYINLGSRDNLKVGMGFEVYAQVRDARPTLRGKASVEIVTLMNDSAECRVMRTTPGQPIVEGDIVVNIAYERNRKPKFVIAGDFDLNYDGIVDFEGPERIKAIVRDWGGQVADELDETTDYVVIGAAPAVPAGDAGQRVSPQVADQIATQELRRGRFKALFERARAMYIPVITQNQFLYLTGYAGDMTLVMR